MALSYSTDKTDDRGRELLTYGSPDFPIAFFDDDLTKVSVPWHWHEELEIVIVTSGVVSAYINGCEIILNAGDGYFANSGVLHSEKLKSKSGHQHALVFSPRVIASPDDIIWKTYVSPILDQDTIPFLKLTPEIPWQKNILSLAEKAWLCGVRETADYTLDIRASLSRIMSLILHDHGTEPEHPLTPKAKKDEARIKRALHFIEANCGEQITIEDISASADISISTLLRLCHDILHTTPIQYVLKYRLERIREELLLHPGLSISETAYSFGFNDISYFNRCFLKEYGKTPSEVRREGMI